MEEYRKYCAMELDFGELQEDDDFDWLETINELEEHLQMNGYDYYIAPQPGAEQILVLLINEEQVGWIDEVLKDRGIGFDYVR